MKRNSVGIIVFIFLACVQLQAQRTDQPLGISFKALMMDYQSLNGGSFSALKDNHPGFEIGLHKNINQNINLVIPFKFGVVNSHDEVFQSHKRIMGLDVQVQYQFYKPDFKVLPYILGGIGGVLESEGEFNAQVPVGAGLQFKVDDNLNMNVQAEYRHSFGENRTNLHYGLGFVYLFGGKESMKKKDDDSMKEDSDGDGIEDDLDLCPNAPGPKELNGCPDKDGDGIADFQDVCPEFAGLKEFRGCPDSDGDGVSDNDDECPNIAGSVENKGCPTDDRDGDGVRDAADRCPDLAGDGVDGCPKDDNDRDGVPNDIDRCPDDAGSPSADGCPDSDGDGLADFEDKCPTLPGSKIYGGCPDTDGDGIDDSRDRCPNSAGPVSTNGCPEISAEDKQVLETAMRAVQFDTGRATLKSESFDILSQIGQIMQRYPDYNLSVSGHTDNTGRASSNQRLSERRAKACYDYLIKTGVSETRLNYAGYGESRPISDNNTLRGRALNRRVEFNLVPR